MECLIYVRVEDYREERAWGWKIYIQSRIVNNIENVTDQKSVWGSINFTQLGSLTAMSIGCCGKKSEVP